MARYETFVEGETVYVGTPDGQLAVGPRDDIVTAVGNVQIDSPDKGFQVFDELSRSDSVTLTVIRDGSTTQIPINFQN